jgi:hypothetical protein
LHAVTLSYHGYAASPAANAIFHAEVEPRSTLHDAVV